MIASGSAVRTVRYGTHDRQFVEVVGPSHGPARGLVLMVHGGFWRGERTARELRPLAADLARPGVAVALPEYRVTDEGAVWPQPLDDVVCAVRDTAAALDVPLRDVVLVGHSAGGHLALLAGAHLPGLRTVVGLAPITDLVAAVDEGWAAEPVGHLLPSATREALAQASPVRITDPLPPVVLLHGDADQTVPVSQSRSFVASRSTHGPGAHLDIVPGARHMHLVKSERPAWQCVRRAVLDAMDLALTTDQGA